MIRLSRLKILLYLPALIYAGGLASQVEPFVVAPADPVVNFRVVAPTVDAITVRLSGLPEGCTSGGVMLPISTPELTAIRLDPALVSLRWKTFDDDYTNRWMLQRRLDQSDDFTNIWELAESAFLRGDRLDNNEYKGTSYYRLFGVSPEGVEVYSSIVSVGNLRQTGQLLVYPNPANATASVNLPSVASAAKLLLVDNLGRVIWRTLHPAGGASTLRLPALEPGAYLLRWETPNGEVAFTRFVTTGH